MVGKKVAGKKMVENAMVCVVEYSANDRRVTVTEGEWCQGQATEVCT